MKNVHQSPLRYEIVIYWSMDDEGFIDALIQEMT